MLKRVMPLFATLIAALMDTALIPVFYYGRFSVPVTFAVVMCISLIRGRLFGLLYGMIGGLVIDITAGTLGVFTFFFMSTGLLMGIILIERPSMRPAWQLWLRRGSISLALYMIGEVVFMLYRYFVTNSFEWVYLFDALVRGVLIAILTMLLFVPLRRVFGGITSVTNGREVKHY